MIKSGIYFIKNKINGLEYIGKAHNIQKRWREHQWALSRGVHANTHLQRAWNKYGYSNFTFDVLERCSNHQLGEKETYWIKRRNSFTNGYNLSIGGEGSDGRILSLETRKKIGLANSSPSPETRFKIGTANRNKKLTEEHRDKISESIKGNNHPFYGRTMPEEIKLKISRSLQGRQLSEGHKMLISEKNKGKMAGESNPMFGKKGEAHPFFGKKHSEAAKTKISIAKIGKNKGENHYCWGKQKSENIRKKISASRKGKLSGKDNPNAKKVVCDGLIFDTISSCAKHLSVSQSALSLWLNEKRATPKKYRGRGLRFSVGGETNEL